MQRITTHVTAGVGVPEGFENQTHVLVPTPGKALFAGAAMLASVRARREFARVLRRIKTVPDRELKLQTTSWFIFEKLLVVDPDAFSDLEWDA